MALNFKDKFVKALWGTPAQVDGVAPSVSYGKDIDNYLNTLGSQPYMQGLLNQPKETALTLDQYKQGVANGLNYGIPEIAKAQQTLGINTPKTGEEIELANVGQFNQPSMLSVGTATTPRQGGFFNDLVSGYQENATQGFNINNLAPVQGKGLATRLGEGLGTLARFYDKPIGRMAVATGLSMLTGETNPLGEGVKAYVGRQNNMTQDRVYRNQLKQLGMTDDELNSIPGNVTKDVFEGVTSGMRLGNQRMTYGQLAMLDDNIAEEVRKNPALADMFVPINIARDIYGLKRETAQGKMAEIAAKTKKTEAETKQVGKPKVTINRREGGTTSTVNIVHSGGSGKGKGTPDRPTQNNYVKMQAPNGKIYNVPRSRMREYINAGGKVVG